MKNNGRRGKTRSNGRRRNGMKPPGRLVSVRLTKHGIMIECPLCGHFFICRMAQAKPAKRGQNGLLLYHIRDKRTDSANVLLEQTRVRV